MALREYVTDDGQKVETLIREYPPPETIMLADGRTARRVLSLPARTQSLWGDTTQTQRYDRGLGRWVSGDREAARIAKERGLVNHRELGDEHDVDQMYDSWVSTATAHAKAEAAEQTEYATNLKKYDGDAVRAVEETWPVGRITAGDTIYAE